MAKEMGIFKATKSSCLEASHPLGLSRWAAQRYGAGGKSPTPAGVGIMMLIGSSIRQEG